MGEQALQRGLEKQEVGPVSSFKKIVLRKDMWRDKLAEKLKFLFLRVIKTYLDL